MVLIMGFIIIAEPSGENIEIKKGKNNLTIPLTTYIDAKTLTEIYPEIEVISYEKNGKSIGYVNVFNGIGKNFVLESNKTYEVISNKNITIRIK
jgi:O-glycosyl hydrolase